MRSTEKEAYAPDEERSRMDVKTKADLIGLTVAGIMNMLFAAFVGFAAVYGGSLGECFAIFVVVVNLRAGARSLINIESVVKDSQKP